MTIDVYELGVVVHPDTTVEDLTMRCELAIADQIGVMWWIGDYALAARAMAKKLRNPDIAFQVWPVNASPGLIDRAAAVAAAYPLKDRNPLATWTIHKNHAKHPDRVRLVQAAVDAGQTSDENRANPAPITEPDPPEPAVTAPAETPGPAAAPAGPARKGSGWLLAVDVNYYIHRYFHSGAGVESASTFDAWLARLLERMAEKGLTDCVCCLDSPTNHRKALTEGWEHGYKPRSEKDAELAGQLNLAPTLLRARNIPVVAIDDMEADDVMASYAVKFAGRVTLLTQDKDMRQCLSATCNILLDVTWEENPETGKHLPVYKWVKARWTEEQKELFLKEPDKKPKDTLSHFDDGMTYSGTKVVGITPELWPHFQAIAGDSTDGIKGCEGIGGKGAMDLVHEHGTVQNIIAACKDGSANLSKKKIEAVLAFEPLAETMLRLTTLRTDLNVPMITKLALKEST